MNDTRDARYTERLRRSTDRRHGWRRFVDPQIPYRWNIRRLARGEVLDIGCGVGRNLAHLDGRGVGIDHNPASVAAARARGLVAFTPDEFDTSPHADDGRFGTLLFAHVLEHLDRADAVALVRRSLRHLEPGGRVVVICPQERGQRSDPTHVTFLPPKALVDLLTDAGLLTDVVRSFPLPRAAGRWFTHNETVAVARRGIDVDDAG